jgi:adenosine deaminase
MGNFQPIDTPKVPWSLPKAEMHVHISLALANESFIRRVKKKRTPLSLDFLIDRETRYYPDLKKFHHTYEAMRHMTSTNQELASTVQRYLERIAREGAIYAEISNSFRNPESFDAQIEAVEEGIKAAKENTGLETRIVVTTLRDHGGEKALEAVKHLKRSPKKYVGAFGLVGDESLNTMNEFSESLHYAWHEAGIGLTPHVAEQYLHNAVDFLSSVPEEAFDYNKKDHRQLRVGHGVLIHRSSELLRLFKERNICLEICLSANKRISLPEETKKQPLTQEVIAQDQSLKIIADNPLQDYYQSIEEHPIKTIVDAGVPVCLGSDNPLLLNTNIGKEHALAHKAGLTKHEDHLNITRNAIKFANVDYETRKKLSKKIDRYVEKSKKGYPNRSMLGYQQAFVKD